MFACNRSDAKFRYKKPSLITPNEKMNLRKILIYFLFLGFLVSCSNHSFTQRIEMFDTQSAINSIKTQLSFGPRYPGSPGHQLQIKWMRDQLANFGWEVELQQFEYKNTQLTNVIAKKGDSKKPILIGTHFDTRRFADRDLDLNNHSKAVPGANDGASGVAVLLEIAKILNKNNDEKNSYWLVFFDGEDQGDIEGWDWIQGSTFFTRSLEILPKAVIVIDMIGDADLVIYQEGFSHSELQDQVWQTAFHLGYKKHFVPEIKYSIIDDHKPFVDLGIPSILLIDLDYPYWHTVNDTLDKISTVSLEQIGNLLIQWLKFQ